MNSDDEWLNTRQAAEYLKVHRVTIQKWRKAGRIRAYTIDGNYKLVRFKKSELKALVEERV